MIPRRHKLKHFIRATKGAALMEFALLVPLLLLLSVAVYEVGAYAAAISKLENSVSSMALAMANHKPEQGGSVELRNDFQDIIDGTDEYLAEHGVSAASYKTSVMFTSGSGLGNFSITSGGLGSAPPLSVNDCPTPTTNPLGMLQVQTCIDYRAVVPEVFGAGLSQVFPSPCKKSCMAVTSVAPNTPPAMVPPVNIPPDIRSSKCRVQTHVDCYGACFPNAGKPCTCGRLDDLYVIGSRARAVPRSNNWRNCPSGIVQGSIQNSPAKTNFDIDFVNVCNRSGNNKGYARDAGGGQLSALRTTWTNQVMVCTSRDADGNCTGGRCDHPPGSWSASCMNAQISSGSYGDCCEAPQSSGNCTEFITTGNRHCTIPGLAGKVNQIQTRFQRLKQLIPGPFGQP